MQQEIIKISLSPEQILHNPLLNKGTAFTQEERDQLGLNGLIPSNLLTVEDQIARAYENFETHRTTLGKYTFLIGLLGRNELLFYQLVSRHVAEMLPIIYTPTVGEAAINYSKVYSEQRGLYLSYPLKDKIDAIFSQYSQKDVQVIVVTDGERILGLGDQGVGGMVIPVGKLALYTIFGGIHPAKTLPILLDVGTNNPDLLNDKRYLGWHHARLSGSEYDGFVNTFVHAVKKHFPKALLQWEDFGKNNARRLLDRYRNELLSFNDDIQGTAAVTVSALLAAVQTTKTKLRDQRFAILGGGSAGTGIADMIVLALKGEGLSEEEAANHIYIVDIDGLLHFNSAHVFDSQKLYVKSQAALRDWKITNPTHISMLDVVKNAHPTALIGVSAQGGAFTREMIEAMQKGVPRPIVFPLSNPTSKAECTPEELIEWTRAQAIIATGSPFNPVVHEGKTHQIGQCNNVYIFPGVGTGVLAAEAKIVTDSMFLEAARTLAQSAPSLRDPAASLFPPLSEVRASCRKIAIQVAKKAIQEGISNISPSDVEKRVDAIMWEPHYPKYTARD